MYNLHHSLINFNKQKEFCILDIFYSIFIKLYNISVPILYIKYNWFSYFIKKYWKICKIRKINSKI